MQVMSVVQAFKKQKLLELLEIGRIQIHLDARHPDVVVPAFLKEDFQLCLSLSYRFADVDLQIDDLHVRAVLSFQRNPFACVIPLHAIWGVTSDTNGMEIFPYDLPPELVGLAALIFSQPDFSSEDFSAPTPLTPPPDLASIRREKAAKSPNLQVVVDNTKEPSSQTQAKAKTRSQTPSKKQSRRKQPADSSGEPAPLPEKHPTPATSTPSTPTENLSATERRARFRVISNPDHKDNKS